MPFGGRPSSPFRKEEKTADDRSALSSQSDSIVSHGVVRRTKEIGLRISLGASRKDVLTLIAREIGTQVAIGLAIGAAAAANAGRAVASQLFGVGARDVGSFVIASAILAFVALLASLVPALRAVRIHPSVALRVE